MRREGESSCLVLISLRAMKASFNASLDKWDDVEKAPVAQLKLRIEEFPMVDAGALEALVSQQIVISMKAHNAERTGTLRLIKNALKNRAIEKRAALTQAESEQTLATMIKQRRDSIEQFTNGNRPELAAKEAAEIVVIEEFLPKAVDEAGLARLVNEWN